MQVITDIENYRPVPCAATIGSFDGVHKGHLSMLGELRAAASGKGLPLMVVTFSCHPRQLFTPRCERFLLTANDEKLKLLEKAGTDICVLLDFNMDMAALSAERFMKEILHEQLGVKMLAVGYDHHFGKPCEGEGLEQYKAYGSALGIEVFGTQPFVVNDVEVSSSAVRRALSAGDVKTAESLLGYRYNFCGVVEHGAALGRALGFPTANIAIDNPMTLIPADGVYEVVVTVDGKEYQAVMNIGVKPTVATSGERTMEAHLIDYSGDLYGQLVKVEFVRRLRGEQVFDNINALRFQIEVDVARVKRGI